MKLSVDHGSCPQRYTLVVEVKQLLRNVRTPMYATKRAIRRVSYESFFKARRLPEAIAR